MRMLLGERRTGKTTKLIETSIITGAHIAVCRLVNARCIHQQAKKLHPDTPLPDVYVIGDKKNGRLLVVKSDGTHDYEHIEGKDLLIDEYEILAGHLVQDAVGDNNIVAGVVTSDEHNWELYKL